MSYGSEDILRWCTDHRVSHFGRWPCAFVFGQILRPFLGQLLCKRRGAVLGTPLTPATSLESAGQDLFLAKSKTRKQ